MNTHTHTHTLLHMEDVHKPVPQQIQRKQKEYINIYTYAHHSLFPATFFYIRCSHVVHKHVRDAHTQILALVFIAQLIAVFI